MYTRNYYQTDIPQNAPPENYDGTAFREMEDIKTELPYEAPDFIPENHEPKTEPASATPIENTVAVSRGLNIPFLSGLGNLSLGGIFGGEGGFLSNIGIEEILIIAIAAYLLFSGSGDIECAVMLLLLLFIG